MDYAETYADRPTPALGQLKTAAERVGESRRRIEEFVERFHGPQACAEGCASSQSPPTTYRNDLDTLFAEIDHLGAAINALSSIG